jgi:AcrR family transcriptional regulator
MRRMPLVAPTITSDRVQSPPDRRAIRRAQTEAALRSAALDLAEERGFDGFTVDEVAQRAGVSPRTFFNYFATKEAAVLSDPRPVLEAMNAALAENLDAPLVEAVHAAVKAFLAVSTARPRDMRRELSLVESQPTLRIALLSHYCAYERTLGRGIAERMGTSVEDDPLPLVLAAAAVAVARIVLMRWSWTGDEAPDEDAVDETLARMGALLAA